MPILSELFYKLYAVRNSKLRDIILHNVAKFEGGQMLSQTLRRILLDYHDIEIGKYSYGGCFNPNNIRACTTIGRYCSFARDVYIFNANHPLTFKSTHPFFYNSTFGNVKNDTITKEPITIGNDVWIGQNVIILPRVTRIGDGAVIGAATVVTQNIPDFAVVVGNPGRIIRYRFSKETIEKIMQEKWWYKDIEQLRANLDDFTRPFGE